MMDNSTEKLITYFKNIENMSDGEFFDKFYEIFSDQDDETLRVKIDETKLLINKTKTSSARMKSQMNMNTGVDKLDELFNEILKGLGIEKGIELADIVVRANIRMLLLMQVTMSTRELERDANDKGTHGGSEDDATDGEAESDDHQ
jgi:hypothetical protein